MCSLLFLFISDTYFFVDFSWLLCVKFLILKIVAEDPDQAAFFPATLHLSIVSSLSSLCGFLGLQCYCVTVYCVRS